MCLSQWQFTCCVSGMTASLLHRPQAAVASKACSAACTAPTCTSANWKRCSLGLPLESKLRRVSDQGPERRLHSPNKEGEGVTSEQEVTLPAALHVPLAGSCPVVSLGAFPGVLHPSGTNVTSGVPRPPRRRRWGARVVPCAPGLRSDGGLVGHQAGHRGQGSLTLMVLLLRSFTGVPFVLCFNIVRCGNTLNGMEVETALEP